MRSSLIVSMCLLSCATGVLAGPPDASKADLDSVMKKAIRAASPTASRDGAHAEPVSGGEVCATEGVSVLAEKFASGGVFDSAISGDGRYVAFSSFSSEIVEDDTNSAIDIFVFDRQNGTVERVSVDSSGNEGNSSSEWPSISDDGRYVAFASYASNLVPGDTNFVSDVFVHDRQTGTTERVSVDSDGVQANDYSYRPSISGDGRYVAFESYANNLVPADTFTADIFVHDRVTGDTTKASVSSGGDDGNSDSYNASVSDDGRYIAFRSWATNLVVDDMNFSTDIFVRDMLTGTTVRASVDSAEIEANDFCYDPVISGDGRFVAFTSYADNLIPVDGNFADDVFVRDLVAGTTSRVSISTSGAEANSSSSAQSISDDGRFVCFESDASNLIDFDFNGRDDIFVRDQFLNETTRVSLGAFGSQVESDSSSAAMSDDGDVVSFVSTRFVVGPDTGFFEPDVFVRDRDAGTSELISRKGSCTGNAPSGYPDVSADGRYVAFESIATDLGFASNSFPTNTVNPTIARIYVRDRDSGSVSRVSGTSLSLGSFNASISADGRYVAFDTKEAIEQGFGGNVLDANGTFDVYVRDRSFFNVSRVSTSNLGFDADGPSRFADVSEDGRYIAFESDATNLVHADRNGVTDVFVRDTDDEITERVSVSSAGSEFMTASRDASISGEGRYVAYVQSSLGIVVFDRQTKQMEALPGTGSAFAPSISADGRFVAFDDDADYADASDTNGVSDVFVYDLMTDNIQRVSVTSLGDVSDGPSYNATISEDGRFVAFESGATNLVGIVRGGATFNAYVHDRATGTTTLASTGDQGAGNGESYYPAISEDGTSVAFMSFATNLIDGDINGFADVFVRDRDCEITPACPGDLTTTGSSSGDPGFGAPDGTTDISDLLYYVNIWDTDLGIPSPNPTSPADVTTTGGTNPGVPDGNVDLSDLLFFVNDWTGGRSICP